MSSIKQLLLDLCISSVQQRITESRDAIRSLQQSANEETKSSAGDKYETGRAMAQLEIEKHGAQLTDANAQLTILESISPDRTSQTVQLGSLVKTSQGQFFVAVSVGQLQVDQEKYFAISPKSPVGQKLAGLTAGQSFVFNGKNFEVLELL